MIRILVTGRDSFIGKNFRRFSKYRNIEEISVRNSTGRDIDFHNYDVVLHLAAIVHRDKKIPENEYFKINRDLSLNIAQHAKESGIKHFIFMSTTKVYGNFVPGSDPWKEDSPCCPDEPYGRSKYEAEIGLGKLASPDFKVTVIRTPVVYGPEVKANIFKLIRLIEKVPLLPFAGINNNRHFTYVENLTGFIDRIIETGISGTFMAMDDKGISTTRLVKNLSEYMNRKILLVKLPDIFIKTGYLLMPDYFDRLYSSFFIDNSKTREILDYSPVYSFEEGLQKTILFYKEQKAGHK
jgi:nucleoside-diphosphate-sugar epimerase